MSLDDQHPPWCAKDHHPEASDTHRSARTPIADMTVDGFPNGWAQTVDWGGGPRVSVTANGGASGCLGGGLILRHEHDLGHLANMIETLAGWPPEMTRALAAQVREVTAQAFGAEAEA
jgi:hypothetical protein